MTIGKETVEGAVGEIIGTVRKVSNFPNVRSERFFIWDFQRLPRLFFYKVWGLRVIFIKYIGR